MSLDIRPALGRRQHLVAWPLGSLIVGVLVFVALVGATCPQPPPEESPEADALRFMAAAWATLDETWTREVERRDAAQSAEHDRARCATAGRDAVACDALARESGRLAEDIARWDAIAAAVRVALDAWRTGQAPEVAALSRLIEAARTMLREATP